MATSKASLIDLAKELSLSVSTISRALSNHSSISDATKKKVWKLAKQMNYQPNQLAAALRKGRSNIIGVMVPTINRNFFASVVRGIETVTNKEGFNIIICQSNDDEASEIKNVEALVNAQVEGVIVSIARSTLDFSHFERVLQRGIPLVLFDRMIQGLDISAVVIDDYQGAFQAVKHLIDQGCRRIAHFAGQDNLTIYRDRLKGYRDALEAHQLPFDEQLVYQCKLTLEAGRAGAEHLLQLPSLPDAIFSASDHAALGAMQVLKTHQIRIPDDIALAGFSNEPITSLTEPMLTTVDQHSEVMGQTAAKLFLEMLQNKSTPFSPRKIVLQAELIIRESSLRKRE
ncbi:MAG: LacI family DNA-binding transcriptional regulator [Bacteroidota bacterium]